MHLDRLLVDDTEAFASQDWNIHVTTSPDQQTTELLDKLLGYLNFSSGAPDPQFLVGINRLYSRLEAPDGGTLSVVANVNDPKPQVESAIANQPLWQRAIGLLESRLSELRKESPAFANADQATSVLETMRLHVAPGYRVFHRDLLLHRTDDALFGPLMLGRMFEALLEEPPPWDSAPRAADRVIGRLNTFLGHRPIPALESQKIEPRSREWVRPIPVYIVDVGVGAGPYERLIELTLEILGSVDDAIARDACFDLEALEELAIDPRSYDFDHPVNRRPNYHFGEWDELAPCLHKTGCFES